MPLQQHKSKKQALASKLSNVASSVSNASRGAVAKLEGGSNDSNEEATASANCEPGRHAYMMSALKDPQIYSHK